MKSALSFAGCCMALSGAGAIASAAHAQTPPPTTALPEIQVQGTYDNAVGTSDAASQGVVRGALLQDQPLLRPGEVLETVPGMVVTQHSGDGKANQYFLRGYNLDHGTDFSTTVDGVPVNMPTNAHGQGYMDLNFLIPELVESIEYRKGPYFAGNGDFSSAGSADIQYRKKLERNIFDVTVGGFGYKRVLLAGSTQLGPSDADGNRTGPTLLGALELARGNGPWTHKEEARKVNGILRLSDGSQARGWSIDLSHYQARWNSTDQVPLELIQSGQLGRFSALDPTDGGRSSRTTLSGEWHTLDNDGYTRASAYVQHSALQLFSNFTFFELRPDTGDQFEQHESRNFFGGQVVRGWSRPLFGKDSVTEVGVQLRHDEISLGLQNTVMRVPFQTVRNDRVGETSFGAWLQNTTSWTDWMRTVVGVREDHVSMNMRSYATPLNSGTASGSRLSPKFSAIFGPWAKTEFFVNLGNGFHSNDARGVIDKIDPSTGQPASAVPALVGSKGKEIGLRTEIVPGLQSSLSFWTLSSASEIIYSADSSIGSTEANGASKRRGIEWNNHWTVAPWLFIDADLAWTHARYADANANGDTGNLIPNAVSKVGMFRATIHRLGPWSAGLETRYIGSYPLSQDGSLRAPAAVVTNLRVQRELSPRVTLSAEVLNLFNRRYYDIAYQQDYQVSPNSPVVPSGVTVHPGEPRQFRVALKVAF